LFAIICISQINAQEIFTVAGNDSIGYTKDSILATNAGMDPYAVKLDKAGNLYIADCGNNRIRKVVHSTQIVYTVAGDTTDAAPIGDGGPATSASLFSPCDIALDSAGNIYIADKYNNRVRKVTVNNDTITTIAGNGIPGYSGDNGLSTSAMLNLPSGLAIDRLGNVYIADAANNCVRKLTKNADTTTYNITTYVSGLNFPNGLAIDNAFNLYIADYGSSNVYKVTKQGLRTIAAGNSTNGFSGDGGLATLAALSNPSGVVLDYAGNLFIADEGNYRIREVYQRGDSIGPGDSIRTIAGGGAYLKDSVLALKAEFVPFGLTMDSIGTLYIADGETYRVRDILNVGTTLGVREISASGIDFKLFPNPNNGKFTIETSAPFFDAGKQNLMIFDISGRLMLSELFYGRTVIDASRFAEGIYTIRLSGKDGVGNKRLVIVR